MGRYKKAYGWICSGVALSLCLLLLAGCANQKTKEPTAADKWRRMAAENKGYSPKARKRQIGSESKKIETIAPKKALQPPEKPLPARPITMKMHQTDVSVLLRALARAVDLNIMINESVKGKISINVIEAPWDQVFKSILKAQALSYEWEGDIVRIITLEDRDRNLKNLEAQASILAKQQELERKAPLITKVIPIDFASAEKLKATAESMIAGSDDEKPSTVVMVDQHTNALVVQATPADIDQIVALITELDKPTSQILIEAHIVETTNRTARELGVQWGGLYFNAGRNFWVTPGALDALGGTSSGDDVDPGAGTGINFPADLGSAAQAGTGMTLGIIGQGSDGILAFQLTALEEEGKLNILSSPSITTLDNTKAVIESGNEVPIPVLQEGETANVIYKDALLSLEVTPHIIQDDALKLEIVTTKNEVDFTRKVLEYPTIVSKKASTNVILFDGQTTVIGGLKKNTIQKSDAGVPWVSKIPLLGNLFKKQGKSEQMEEILIFITPYILKTRPADNPAAPVNEQGVAD